MELPEDHTHAFIVRFWLEPREIQGERPLWRGAIEHVPSGRKFFLKSLDEVTAFIESYLPGINKINLVVDENADISQINESCTNFLKILSLNSKKLYLNFIENDSIDRENGYSFFLGANNIKSYINNIRSILLKDCFKMA